MAFEERVGKSDWRAQRAGSQGMCEDPHKILNRRVNRIDWSFPLEGWMPVSFILSPVHLRTTVNSTQTSRLASEAGPRPPPPSITNLSVSERFRMRRDPSCLSELVLGIDELYWGASSWFCCSCLAVRSKPRVVLHYPSPHLEGALLYVKPSRTSMGLIFIIATCEHIELTSFQHLATQKFRQMNPSKSPPTFL